MTRNISVYPWFKFFQSLTFWQATWFLFFESHLSASEAILLYAIYDIATTVFEVPSGYMSDRLGRRLTLIAAGLSAVSAAILFLVGQGFFHFALAHVILGASAAFASGTDSSMLFESLKAEDRQDEIEAAELRAWRFSFTALAISALTGGLMAAQHDLLPYAATACAALITLALALQFREPIHTRSIGHRENLQGLVQALRQPTLLWILCLFLVMYVFSHIPYVFGQPFIREALATAGGDIQAPIVSGSVTFAMMIVSVAVSLIALRLRRWLGLPKTLLLAFSMQIGLTAALALSNGLFVVVLLFFRMVPDSLSQPFIKARIQPLLRDGTRATYMSIQSLAGRVLFALTLSIAAQRAADDVPLPYADLQVILSVYAGLGVLLFLVLFATAKRAKV